MITEFDLDVDGRTVRAYDSGHRGSDELVVFWHHASPQIGAPPAPLFSASDRLDIRWVSYDRPGYGGSTAIKDRDVALVTRDVVAVVDALGIETFAVMGHSGGCPHALACGALLPERVLGVVSVAAQAPFDAGELDWFGGMAASNVQEMRAAAAGRAELEAYESSEVLTDLEFTADDMATLNGGLGMDIRGRRRAARPGRADRGLARLCQTLGMRPGRHCGADAAPARRAGPRRPEHARALAPRHHPVGRAPAVRRRRAHIRATTRGGRPGLVEGAAHLTELVANLVERPFGPPVEEPQSRRQRLDPMASATEIIVPAGDPLAGAVMADL